jgi:hypothetical protein
MSRALEGSIATPLAAALLLGISTGAANVAAAQEQGSAASTAVPRMADGRPDLSGVWWGGADVGGRRPGGGGGPPGAGRPGGAGGTPPPTFTSLYQPWAAEHAKTLSDQDDPTLHCVPVAFGTLNVRLWNVGAVGQIIATPKMVVMLSETFHTYQLVPPDGRPHRDDAPPSYRGDAVGRWDGDTFVVDITNFTDDTWMSAEGRVSFHSDALHIVERYRRVDASTLEIEATVEDPKVLTGPWTVPKQTLQLAPFDQLLALDCFSTEAPAMINSAEQRKP